MVAIPSDTEMRKFVTAVQSQTAKVTAAYIRSGRDIMDLATPVIKQAIVTIAGLQKRYAGGDFVHTAKEEEALKAYSQWLVEAWHNLHGTEIPKTTWIRER